MNFILFMLFLKMTMLTFAAASLWLGLFSLFFGVETLLIVWNLLFLGFEDRLGEMNSCQISFLLGLLLIEINHTFALVRSFRFGFRLEVVLQGLLLLVNPQGCFFYSKILRSMMPCGRYID